MLDDTTRSDLENLLGEVDVGWEALTDTTLKFGEGGCLLIEMNRMLIRQGVDGAACSDEGIRRRAAMIRALGFTRSSVAELNHDEMFKWNDAQTDPDAIKARIKNALNQ